MASLACGRLWKVTTRLSALILFVCFLLSACGGSGRRPQIEGSRQAGPDAPSLAQQLDTEMERLAIDPKRALAAPGPGNAVFDLRATLLDPDGDGPFEPNAVRLEWSERLIGDYDQNGEVNAADLAPLGLLYGQEVQYRNPTSVGGIEWWPSGDPGNDGLSGAAIAPADGSGAQNWRRARIDGDFNGELGLGDVTPIAMHWHERLSGYRVYRKGPGEADFVLLPDITDPGSPCTVSRSGADGTAGPDANRPRLYALNTSLGSPGEYEFYVAAYDKETQQEGPPSAVTLPELNQRPVAYLSSDVNSGMAPLTVHFDASQSYDPEGSALHYSWDFNRLQPGVDETDSLDPLVEHTYSVSGKVTARLTVSDEQGAEASVDLDLDLSAELQAVLKLSPPSGIVPFEVTLDPSGSLSSVGIRWYELDIDGDGDFDSISADPGSLTRTVSIAGEHEFGLRVTDEESRQSTVTSSVTGYDKVHAEISTNQSIGISPLTVQLSGAGSLGHGQLRYSWDLDDDGVYERDNYSGYTTYATFSGPGGHKATLKVTDDLGESDTANLLISLKSKPTASIYVDGIAVESNPVSFSAVLSEDPDGPLSSYRWDFETDGTDDEETTLPFASHTYAATGSHKATLTVVDKDGLTASANVTFLIFPGKVEASVKATPDSGIAPMLSLLDASGSYSNAGSLAQFEWDWEYDGVPDFVSSGPTAAHVFGGGQHTAAVTVSDDKGFQGTATIEIDVFDGAIILRNDGGLYPANLAALEADLTLISGGFSEVSYSPPYLDDYLLDSNRLIIWYRGGPDAGGEPSPDTRAWTDAEIDDFLALLSAGARIVLFSQNVGFTNHGTLDDYANAWETMYGCSLVSPAFGEYPPGGNPDPRRFNWAASTVLDDGIGFGAPLGFFPSAPTSVIGDFGARFGGSSVNAAERWSSGSGYIPIKLAFSADSQFSGIGYYDAFGSSSWGLGFTPGLSVDPPANDYDLAYFSWGNLYAPDANIGDFPNYHHELGQGVLWVAAYPWTAVSITSSSPSGMGRQHMLQNILGWLTR